MGSSMATASQDIDMIRRELFSFAMRGRWDAVLGIYGRSTMAYSAKITKADDTALHIAVSDGQEAKVEELISLMCSENLEEAKKALKVKNGRGNTPLHLAASHGKDKMCSRIAKIDPNLVVARNNEEETPLFLAVLHGKKDTFLCLHDICETELGRLGYRRKDGETILHVAISGEYFDLAFQIIQRCPELVNFVNERGISPLHLLASKPTAFRSGSHLKGYSKIIYHCTFVNEPTVDNLTKSQSSVASNINYPDNYETCISFFQLLTHGLKFLRKLLHKTKCFIGDAENQQGNHQGNKAQEHGILPSSYYTCFELVKVMSKAMLVILGLGSSQIRKIQEKKEKHVWSVLIMKELLQRHRMYEYEDSGMDPQRKSPDEIVPQPTGDSSDNVTSSTNSGTQENQHQTSKDGNTDEKNQSTGLDESKQKTSETGKETPIIVAVKDGVTEMVEKILDKFPVGDKILEKEHIVLMLMEKPKTSEKAIRETPILIAAKNGIREMVASILELFPVSIHDLNWEKKNAVLLAVEHRQPHVYELLLQKCGNKDSVFRQVDDKGNSALHLAATLGDYKPWLIPGAALQMQWELKWYEFVKSSMPYHFFVRHNKEGKTPKDIFTNTHQDLVKSGGEWLTNTSVSCSVVAALIATVAFATSATVPGGFQESSGTPILENQPAFNAFAVSSIVALCFSVTSVVMFLAILTSRYQEKDFARDLPRKLLLGLSSLLVSIAAILVSFCAGHFFVLKDKLKYAAFPVYAVTCLPVTFFAVAQFPLYFDLVWAAFKKVPQRSYMAVPL